MIQHYEKSFGARTFPSCCYGGGKNLPSKDKKIPKKVFINNPPFSLRSCRGGSAWSERLTHKLRLKGSSVMCAKISGGRGFNSRPRHLIYILNRRKTVYFFLPDIEPFLLVSIQRSFMNEKELFFT